MKFLILTLLFSLGAIAATQESTTKIKQPKKQIKNDKADQLITNRAFRASGGSLSNWSISTAFSYSGGSLSRPTEVQRPNLNAAGDIAAIQGLTGDVSVSYRMTKVDRLNFGVGVQMLAPFHDSIDTADANTKAEFDNNQGELDINNPSVTYTRIANLNGLQSVFSVSAMRFTTGNLTDLGFNSRIRTTWNTMYRFKKSGFSAGVLFLGSRYLNDDKGVALEARQLDNEFAVLPQIEYVINDTFNLRTISRAWWYQSTVAESDYNRLEYTQSVGLGISVTRDVFLYPNIQFLPNDLSADLTNIGINANINIL